MVSWPDCWFGDQLIVRTGVLSADSKIAVISGPSGVGKTTLLRAICKHNETLNPRLVFQEPTLLPWLTVAVNLEIVCADKVRRDHWLRLFGLPEVLHLRPGQLSLGMQRRIAIVRGILANAGLLLLDEPSASLDPENIQRLVVNVRTASQESRIPIVIVTHTPFDFEDLNPCHYELAGKPAVLCEVSQGFSESVRK